MDIVQPDCLCPDELDYYEVSEMKAGMPYRIRPTDVLPSPITLENVRIEISEPKDISTSGYTLKGTFQANKDVPAFGVIDVQHQTQTVIHSVEGEKTEGLQYELSGRPANTGSKGVIISSGRKTLY